MTTKEMYDRISGEKTKANNAALKLLNDYGSAMYRLGCVGGEESIRNSVARSQLEGVIKAMFLDCNKGITKLTIVEYACEGTTVVYCGRACDVPDSLYDKSYTVLNITTEYDDQRGVYVPDGMKTITVIPEGFEMPLNEAQQRDYHEMSLNEAQQRGYQKSLDKRKSNAAVQEVLKLVLNEVQRRNYQKFIDKCKSHTIVAIDFKHYSVTESGEEFNTNNVLYAINTEIRGSTPYIQLVHLGTLFAKDFLNGTLTPERMANELMQHNTFDRNLSLMHLMREVFADRVVVTNPEFLVPLFAYTGTDFNSLLFAEDPNDALEDESDGARFAEEWDRMDAFYDDFDDYT